MDPNDFSRGSRSAQIYTLGKLWRPGDPARPKVARSPKTPTRKPSHAVVNVTPTPKAVVEDLALEFTGPQPDPCSSIESWLNYESPWNALHLGDFEQEDIKRSSAGETFGPLKEKPAKQEEQENLQSPNKRLRAPFDENERSGRRGRRGRRRNAGTGRKS
ncbi:hypothetical protein EX30DRAFT_338944 [Ascodesmis nigricans]|uniref:Uncharacterized protein n=1 Tax=Ascodesmis nigricans TaxID=341454 RepID=A0A4S2N567_9PEZI|nr:hypothetical protein EX30DRAFT_338944 [Ascodesmis nigricans]